MATARFRVTEHTISTSYVREYPRATAGDQEVVLKLAVKQYVPLTSAVGQSQVTVISAPGNGFPKEIYEPLWDDLHDRLHSQDVYINSIWIADYSQQGDSGVLNESDMGNDPSWMDHSRDLFLMINQFRSQMKRPLVGIAHSMGGCTLINLALMHSRLLTTLVLMDPALVPELEAPDYMPSKTSINRRERWPSREVAETAFKRTRYYRSWDPRVIDKWFRYGYLELPVTNPESDETVPKSSDNSTAVSQVTGRTKEMILKTSPDQEVATAMRLNFKSTDPNPITHPDADLSVPPRSPFYRPELHMIHSNLPYVRPSVFYIFAGASHLSTPERQAEKANATGIGRGGSGGLVKGRVRSHSFPGVGHLFPMERVAEAAALCSSWLVPEVARWQELEQVEKMEWDKVPRHERNRLSEDFKRKMNGWDPNVLKETAKGKGPKL